MTTEVEVAGAEQEYGHPCRACTVRLDQVWDWAENDGPGPPVAEEEMSRYLLR